MSSDMIEVTNSEIDNIDSSVSNKTVKTKKSKDTDFNTILTTLTTFKSQITTLQNHIRILEKQINKEFSLLEKKTIKQKKTRKPSGFAKSSKISDELCEFMKVPTGSEMARTEVTKYIVDYIKTKSLQKEENKKYIKPDNDLKSLLGVTDEDDVTYFNIQKYMNRHFIKNEKNEITEC
jgi:chromatin remodeling complex protein RSC6